MAKQQARVTLEDVARECGYSRATVSRVVNGQPNVDPAIAAAVQVAVSRTGYSVNVAARSLAGGASHNVGLVFAEGFRELFQNPYWGEIVEGLSSTLAEHGYRETFLVRDQRQQLDIFLAQRGLDAVVIMSPAPDDHLERELLRLGIPTVVFGRPSSKSRTSSAAIDEESAGLIAARQLLTLQRRHPVVIAGRDDMQVSTRRVAGFVAGYAEQMLTIEPTRIAQGEFTVAGGYRAMHALLAGRRKVDAVFACSDRMALGALQALHERGVAIPDDVAVIGVDGTVLGEQAQPRLTSVGADLEAIGRELGVLTLEAIARAPIRTVEFAPALTERDSA
jgi:DNA-binding LacI/PurR family transcriptional regulator